MKKLSGVVSSVGLILAMCAPVSAEPSPARLIRQTYEGAFGERDYFVYLPIGYESDTDRRWPLLMFLHGNGERGDAKKDLDWVMAHGPLYEAWVYKRDLPFVMVSPQLPLFGFDKTVDYIRDRDPSTIPRRLVDGSPPRPEEFPTTEPMTGAPSDSELPIGPEGPPMGWPKLEADLLTILDQSQKTYRTDPRRVYLTGLSYGGWGTWHLASRHPDRFAAIAPIAGWGHPELMKPLAERQMPIWAFAGGRDPVVKVQHFYPGLNELERLNHSDVRFTVHEDPGHDVWRRVYAGRDLYDWLLAHELDAPPAPASE